MPRAKAPARNNPSRGNRRGSPEAIEKRRVARLFNDVLLGRGGAVSKLDGRTEKRRQRLLAELESGKRGQRDLKPIEVLQHVDELLGLGETVTTLRKVVKTRKLPAPPDGLAEVVERLHHAYHFRPEAYRFVGLTDDVLKEAGVLASGGSASASRPKAKKGAPGRRA